MPPRVERVPISTVKTAPLDAPTAHVNAPIDAFGAAEAQALQRGAQQLDAFAARSDKTLNLIDETSAKEAELSFSRALGDMLQNPETGYYGKRGRAALDAYDDSRKSVDELVRTHTEGLSPAAARLFSNAAGRRAESALASMDAHRRKEAETWAAEASQARVANALAEAEAGYTSDEVRNRSLAVGRAEIQDEAERRGQNPELTKLQLRTFESSLHRSVIARMADADPAAAVEYHRKHGGSLTGNDIAVADKLVKTATLKADTVRYADQFMEEARRTVPSPAASLHAAVAQVESGNDPAAVSRKGAEGVMQVMPATQGNPGFGVRPVADGSPEEKARVGRDYLDAMLSRYGGNQTLALAAYNAGPGKVDEWLKSVGDPRTGMISAGEWTARLPYAETRDYIAKVGRVAASPAGGLPPLDAALAPAREIKDPALREAVEARITTENARQEKGRRDREEADVKSAWTHVERGGAVESLPADLYARLEGTPHIRALRDFSRQMAAGAPPPRNSDTFAQLYVMAATDPERFRHVDLLAVRDKVEPGQWTELLKSQTDLRDTSGQPDEVQKAVASMLSTADAQIRAAGLDPKSERQEDLARYVQFQLAVGKVAEAAVKSGKRLTPNEELAAVGRLLVEGKVTGTGWFVDDKRRAFEVGPNETGRFAPPVPPAERVKIEAALKRRNLPVTEEAVTRLYSDVLTGGAGTAPAPARPLAAPDAPGPSLSFNNPPKPQGTP